jgi:hypothetical protein
MRCVRWAGQPAKDHRLAKKKKRKGIYFFDKKRSKSFGEIRQNDLLEELVDTQKD